MDLSTLTEDQQKQLQQLHQQFQQHQLEQQQKQQQQQQQQQELQQQQQQELVSQAYDPSQAQPYDQSTQAYYNYHHYQHYPYYYPDYANAYYQSQPSQPESTAVQPPGISAALDATAASQVQLQQNAYYSQLATEHQQASSSAYPVPAGLNPAAAAAVAALSQLTQFAGSMDAAERAMAQERQWQAKVAGYGPSPGPPMPMMPPQPPHMLLPGGFPHAAAFPGPVAGRPPFRGGGRRGGGPSRGGGRGNFGQHQSKPDGSASQLHKRGRGRGGGRQYQHDSSSHPETTSVEELASASVLVPLVAVEQGESQHSASIPTLAITQGKATSSQQQPQIAWCELCRVDCTSLEILEQHKNGKKHKKNLQRLGESQNARNFAAMPISVAMPLQMPTPMAAGTSIPAPAPVSGTVSASVPKEMPVLEVQNQVETQPESKSEAIIGQPENTEGGETNMSAASENKPAKADNDEKGKDTEQNNLAEKTEVGKEDSAQAPARKRRFDRLDGGRRMKKNMRHGHGGKRLRNGDRPNRPVEPPKEVIPKVCDLCNVKCDTQAVFESHLAGKKHLSKLKRFQSHQATYGQVGLQALYPPNPNAPPIFIPPVHQQGLYFPHGPFPPMPYMPPNPEQQVAGSGCLAKQGTETQSAQFPQNGSQKAVMLNPNDRQTPAAVGHEEQAAVAAVNEQQAPMAVGTESDQV